LNSPWHEERFCGWLVVLNNFNKSDNKDEWYKFTIKNIKQLNNWDLVDKIAPNLIGKYLENKNSKQILEWSSNRSLWIRRIAILATWPKIKNNEFNLTLKIAKIYLSDSEDLIHKATGWMLREIGKRNEKVLLSFMNKNHKKMPRITVSYALERINKKKKQQYMIKSSRKIH
jgi:Predicted DNA alkylation repair enzyme